MPSKEELEAMGINQNKNEINLSNAKSEDNSVATAVKIIGYVEIICGIILGIILGNTFGIGYNGYDFNVALCIGTIIAGIICGIFIVGFGEIIQKLQNIENNVRK